jgi:hypothetical protein
MTRRLLPLFLIMAACGGGKSGAGPTEPTEPTEPAEPTETTGSAEPLDRGAVQLEVAAAAKAQVGVAARTVTCPDQQPAASGTSFTCDVAFEGGGALAFAVRVEAAGSLAIAPTGAWMRGDQMAADLTTEMFLLGHDQATVDCGGAVIAVQVPGATTCKVTQGGKTADVEVAVDAQRDITWKVVGAL